MRTRHVKRCRYKETALIFYFFQVWTKYLEMYVLHAISYKRREKTVKKFP